MVALWITIGYLPYDSFMSYGNINLIVTNCYRIGRLSLRFENKVTLQTANRLLYVIC